MPVFQLIEEIVFPHASQAEDDGLLAIGGDLSPNRILNAYVNGIFPWYSPDEPILWWSPNPRCVLFPDKLKISKSLGSVLKKEIFQIRFDTNFLDVIKNCSSAKRGDDLGTWISDEIIDAYNILHQLGYAHSVETYRGNKLVGGLYGIAIGKVFFGESMFFIESNASKVAFCALVKKLKEDDFYIIDNQVTNKHLLSLGAEEIKREKFLDILKKYIVIDNKPGKWANLVSPDS
jgi:leucyl/phenylalanyl-tRNA---protein transferase